MSSNSNNIIKQDSSNNTEKDIPIAISIPDESNKGTFANVPNMPQTTSIPFTDEYYDNRVISTTHYIETQPESEELQLCWQYGKTVKFISCIDAFFCILNGLAYWPLLFLSIMPIFGYYGSKEYSIRKISVYGVYCILLIMGRIIQLDMIYTHKYDNDSSLNTSGAKFIIFFSLFVQFWITWLVYRFCDRLHKLTPTQLNTLRIGTYIPVQTRILYY
tara:strand:+ start:1289 stop:1939 length:651 start_codon:yes stop_codon:yes gene_type:complete